MSDVDIIKEIRDETGLSVAQISKALKETMGDKTKAVELLRSQAETTAAKKGERSAKDGTISAYIHTTGKIGALVSLACETDFVARNDNFKELARDLAMHASAMRPADEADMLNQPFVKDPSMTVQGLINQNIAKLGENIKLLSVTVQAIGQ